MDEQGQQKPWHKRPDETEKAYQAFEFYRDLPPDEKSILRAYYEYCEWRWDSERASKERQKSRERAPAYFNAWSANNEWVDRREAYWRERRLAAQRADEEAHLEQIREHREQVHEFASEAMQSAAALMREVNASLARFEGEDEELIMDASDLYKVVHSLTRAFEVASQADRQVIAIDELIRRIVAHDEDSQ